MALRADNYSYAHLTTGTNTVKLGNGVLRSIMINTSAAGTITVEDALTDTTPVIAVITCVAAVGPTQLKYDLKFTTGLIVKLSATMDLTVVYE